VRSNVPFGSGEPLAHLRLRVTFTLAVLVAAGLGLGACGRAGPRELPPGPAVTTPTPAGAPVPGTVADAAEKAGVDAQGRPVAGPGQKRPFFLDWLLF